MAFPDPYPSEYWPFSAENCEGLEFDWFAADSLGQLAVFSSAGKGFIPARVFAKGPSSYNDLIAIIGGRSAAGAILEFTGPGHLNDWKVFTEHGLFAYDFQDVHRIRVQHRNGYDLIFRPAAPANISELPNPVSEYLPRIATIFGSSDLLALAMLGPDSQL